jgi:hypothetical protein
MGGGEEGVESLNRYIVTSLHRYIVTSLHCCSVATFEYRTVAVSETSRSASKFSITLGFSTGPPQQGAAAGLRHSRGP